MSVTLLPSESGTHSPPGHRGAYSSSREWSFRHCATIALTVIGFIGLYTGLSHLLNGRDLFAIILALVIQGLAVMSIHSYKGARSSGGSFNLLRGAKSLVLYVALTAVIVTFSYSFYYRLQRADDAANEIYRDHKQTVLSKLVQLESGYKSMADGFAALSRSAEVRAQEEERNGNTCKIASPKGAGSIRQFRRQDALAFSEYANQVSANVDTITARVDALHGQALGKGVQIRDTQAALNEMTDQINAALIGNPMLSGIIQFIDGRLSAADNIAYFGKTIKCDDELRTSQLLALKAAAGAIAKEPTLAPVKLLDPQSVYENALIAANTIAALVESANPLSKAKLQDLDPRIKRAKLSTGGKVYVSADYMPLIFAASIDFWLFLVVPAPRRDLEKRDFLNALARGDGRVNLRSLRTLVWLAVSVPVDDASVADLSEAKPLNLPAKFVRLRPYLHAYQNRYYLTLPHVSNAALLHDYASAVVLKGHAKPLVEEYYTVENLPTELWVQRLLHLLAPQAEGSSLNALVSAELLDRVYAVPVRVLEVSREFFAWMIGQVVEMDEGELKPEPPPQAKRTA